MKGSNWVQYPFKAFALIGILLFICSFIIFKLVNPDVGRHLLVAAVSAFATSTMAFIAVGPGPSSGDNSEGKRKE